MTSPRDLVLLGSTGSIGTQAIDVARRNPDRFRVVALGAGGGNVGLLAAQALDLGVEAVGVARASVVQDLQLAFYAEASRRGWARGDVKLPKIIAGPDAMTELAQWPGDVVLNGVVGSLGLAPTLAALRAGRTLALANKESLVAGGPLVRAAMTRPEQIVPVDSEHTALAQCLRSGCRPEVRRLIVTASGGPFRGWRRDELTHVTPEQALAHPTWDMGPVITINSATMVNKALEVIEAHELFGVPYADITVTVHPQSVIHSMVEFVDGSTIAQASPPDMRLPIAVALGWPDRVPDAAPAVDWTTSHTWQFAPLDDAAFPAVALAKAAGEAGRSRPAIYNAANEECVAAFVAGRLPFLGIVDTLEQVLADAPDFGEPGTVEDVLAAESWARGHAQTIIEKSVEGA
ncbi:1-deoxy-D-xylulose-5-phosphate reductoisomerase [Salinispora arenicola]|uniref:1-deoxy-D-xylulose 5-phosphate reductoisomerase n=1 Tax=Salinispora arenicola TaxID=168697 RepID=A0A542XVP1_SALAC|nr:1-deoxy-D-xylulose-5-phosphate reductoisomerase [Salinispora arenicola]MCN0153484.1 1-deoxy-D-xylulose-5-phosphate reductoisomerase [Salinispora arenicola]TQL39773.1 1-deoxy-D-xylulose 5-phosphate reductoisomerase [Salinispora arenicola]GIM81095.1 1-deoxy-D-xylulose 5-phosphate reductoisomerase [Salinispora arenicola]